MFKKAQASFWTAEEIDLANDLNDWETLKPDEQFFIKHVLAFFAASDGIVNENLVERFCSEVQYPEARFFYGFQIMIENVHSRDVQPADRHVRARTRPRRCTSSTRWRRCRACARRPTGRCAGSRTRRASPSASWPLPSSRASSSRARFCAIFWLKKRGLMPGLTFSNELISRDEGMHCDFACMLYSHAREEAHRRRAARHRGRGRRVRKGVCLRGALGGAHRHEPGVDVQYIEFCADRLLVALGAPKLYNATNPFDWMELISLQGKTCAFFHSNTFNHKHTQTHTHTHYSHVYTTVTSSRSASPSTRRPTSCRA